MEETKLREEKNMVTEVLFIKFLPKIVYFLHMGVPIKLI